ncbi:cytochrome C-552 [Candidatus Nitromaritima sp. SCGC AAA799-C22]|nr:cytochrome C-552 [Candidatus Nitromaritima sp. SCGC AAA799-C22]
MKPIHVWAVLTATAVFVFTPSCAPKPNKEVPPEYRAGQDYFHKACANCHGADALGKNTKAPGLIDAEYLPDNVSDDEIREQIIEGSDKMPAQRKAVTDAQIDEIIKYLRYSQQAADLVVTEDDPDDGEAEEDSAAG